MRLVQELTVVVVVAFGFYVIGYSFGKHSPCQDVEATDIFKVEPK